MREKLAAVTLAQERADALRVQSPSSQQLTEECVSLVPLHVLSIQG